MADTPKVYVLCDQNCKYEGLTKEQIYTAIAQAIETGEIGNVDTGFITTVKTINGTGLKFFVGEQHEYEALTEEQKSGLFAIITNDTTKEGLLNALESLGDRTQTLEAWRDGVASGETPAAKATHADSAASASLLQPILIGGIGYSFTDSSYLNIVLDEDCLYWIVKHGAGAATLLVSRNYGGDQYSTVIGLASALSRFRYDKTTKRLYYESAKLNSDTSFSLAGSVNGKHTIYIYKIAENINESGATDFNDGGGANS